MNLRLSYEERAKFAQNPAAKKLFLLMAEKKTNLAAAADYTDAAETIKLAELIGEEIAVLKTHADIWKSFSKETVSKIAELSRKHNFMIFEDRKFADIGNIVRLQYSEGIYRIADWANLVSAHLITGPAIIDAICNAAKNRNDGVKRGVLVLAQMSSAETFATGDYTKKCVGMANSKKDAIAGYIGAGSDENELKKLSSISFDGHIIFTPGIHMKAKADNIGQRYAAPDKAIFAGSDVIIVGRGICESENPAEEAKLYRNAGWNAYLKRIRYFP
jgi:orotidine 5'-phosphate decarboxylase subfamily 1